MSAPATTRPPMFGQPDRWALVQADSLAFLKQLPERSVDCVITDPPYGIGFQGRAWDAGDLLEGHGFTNWSHAWASEARRVLKPGGYLAAFGATRTMHRLIAGIEDAGLEIRDQVLWLYGSGMPKGPNIYPDLGTTLKPAYEPIVLARAPLDGSTRHTLEQWGTAVMDIGAARVRDELQPASPSQDILRWPANVGLNHEADCAPDECQPECAVVQLDNRVGRDVSRFFYAGKATRSEREAGLEHLPPSTAPVFANSGLRPRANVHPTVKPIALMRWLVRLLAPPGGVVVDPFAGSGSTGCAALMEGRQFIGIEREAEFVQVARARLAHWSHEADTPPDQPTPGGEPPG